MDNVEILLKKYFKEKNQLSLDRKATGVVLDEEDFVLYCQDRLEGASLERFQSFLTANRWAQDMVLEARGLMEEELPERQIPAGLTERAKRLMRGSLPVAPCPHCGRSITPFKRPASRQKWENLFWLVVMLGSFTLSFVFRRYFMQFLVLTLLAGFKWVMEMRASKTQIMIYRALSEESDRPADRLKKFQENK